MVFANETTQPEGDSGKSVFVKSFAGALTEMKKNDREQRLDLDNEEAIHP
jgi:hypothetical protein